MTISLLIHNISNNSFESVIINQGTRYNNENSTHFEILEKFVEHFLTTLDTNTQFFVEWPSEKMANIYANISYTTPGWIYNSTRSEKKLMYQIQTINVFMEFPPKITPPRITFDKSTETSQTYETYEPETCQSNEPETCHQNKDDCIINFPHFPEHFPTFNYLPLPQEPQEPLHESSETPLIELFSDFNYDTYSFNTTQQL